MEKNDNEMRGVIRIMINCDEIADVKGKVLKVSEVKQLQLVGFYETPGGLDVQFRLTATKDVQALSQLRHIADLLREEIQEEQGGKILNFWLSDDRVTFKF